MQTLSSSYFSIKKFLLGQYFYDGLKITFGILFPSIICYYYGHLDIGMSMSMGALIVSIPDNPGAVNHKRNAMLITCFFMFFMAVLIGFTNWNTYILSVEIFFFCFFLSMLTVYGARASAVGIALLLVIILGIDRHYTAGITLMHAGIMFAGGMWYFLLSMVLTQVVPYLPAEQTLGECIQEIAEFIRIKSRYYDKDVDFELQEKKLMDQQVLVNQQLENVREILFKTKKILKDSSPHGNRLIMSFIDVVDLYEHSIESHIDYQELHHLYEGNTILFQLRNTISNYANELSYIGMCIHNREHPVKFPMTGDLLIILKNQIDKIEARGINTLPLKKILINLRNMNQRLEQMYSYHKEKTNVPEERRRELNLFTPQQSYISKIFFENLTFKSNVFRHSMRVAIVCFIAFIFARNFYTGNYSYWILLTIIVILKPAFSQTKKRNADRIIGTIAGGLLGIMILHLIEDKSALFWIMVVFMLFSYSFARLRYVVSVFFMTPYILIVYNFVGENDHMILQERILDTFIGAGIATLGSYFLLPSWESNKIKEIAADLIYKNILYFQHVINYRPEDSKTHTELRLARKNLYVATSNMTSAFQRMLNEPKSRRKSVNKANSFIILNNLINANTAALSNTLKENPDYDETQVREFRKYYAVMKEVYSILTGSTTDLEFNYRITQQSSEELKEIAQKMQQSANEIKKIAKEIQ